MTHPDNTDVVVRQKSGNPTAVLGTPSAPAQFQVRTRDKAVARALAFAKHQHVRAWFANDDDDFVLLGTFRQEQVEPARLPEAMGDEHVKEIGVMETLTFRPKRDRRTQPRIPPTDIADRAYELYRQGGEHGKATALPLRRGDVLRTRRTPEDGDIVVREQQREGTLVFVLHTAPGADQHVLRNREEAVAQAVTFAKRQHVGAWLTDEGYDFVLLEDFRVVESV